MKILCCIMVKNEESNILRTMRSAAPYVDGFVIYDTGSTDETVSIIGNYANTINIPVHIKLGQFVDYSTSRNVLLEYAESLTTEEDFLMLLDSNDEVRVDIPLGESGNFRDELCNTPSTVSCIMANSYWKYSAIKNVLSHLVFLFIRPHKNCRYHRKRHEFIYENGKSVDYHYYIHGIDIYQDRDQDDAKTQSRLENDIEVLTAELKNKATKVRALYYLGKTYSVMHKFKEAKSAFKNRLKYYEGDLEELYLTYVHIGGIYELEKKTPKAIKYFYRAYKCMQRIEPLLYLSRIYLSLQQYQMAYMYTSVACKLSIPKHACTYNYKDYMFDRYILHAQTCYNIKQYEEGSNSLEQVSQYNFPLSSGDVDSIEKLISAYITASYAPIPFTKQSTRPIILFVCGKYWNQKWDGRLADSEDGIGGSELVAIKYAEYVAKHYEVYFVCDCEKALTYKNVNYIPLISYIPFLYKHQIHSLIAFRDARLIKYMNVENVYLSVEDLMFLGGSLEFNATLFKKVFYKSKWHQNYSNNVVSALAPYSAVMGNGLDPERFVNPTPKIPGRIIWSSGAMRGLSNVVRMMPQILATFPEVELHVFIDSKITNYGPETDSFKVLLDSMNSIPQIKVHPHISQSQLATEIAQSEFWLYPVTMDETYCITALEMMAGGVHCIYTPRGALTDTISTVRGWEVIGDPCSAANDYKWVVAMLNCRINDYKLGPAKKWALAQTWDKRGEELLTTLGLTPPAN